MYGNKLTDLYAKNEFHSTFGTRDNKRTIESGFSQPSKTIKLRALQSGHQASVIHLSTTYLQWHLLYP